MKAFLSHLGRAAGATLLLAVVCGVIYPLVVTGIAQLLFPDKANGSLIVGADGSVHGSKLLGQNFSKPKFFHPRPSSAGQGYDAVNSGGSNLGPTSRSLKDIIQTRIKAYRLENGLADAEPVPADAVTGSGSGLDPHISLRNAEWQTPRVARARGVPETRVRELIRQHTEGADLGILGEAGVNVLTLNLALERL